MYSFLKPQLKRNGESNLKMGIIILGQGVLTFWDKGIKGCVQICFEVCSVGDSKKKWVMGK